MAAIDDLVRLVAPPVAPVAASGDWTRVESALGLQLPADFKALLGHYGVGQFDDIGLRTPFLPGNLVEHALAQLDLHRPYRERAPADYPYPLYPEPGGLLEWATTGNGDGLCWLTEGEPDSWPVAVWNHDEACRYDLTATELLFEYLSGQREVCLLGPVPEVAWFDAYRERVHVYVRLSEGHLPYPDRLRVLRSVLAPTADRGTFDNDRGGRQDHFKAVNRDWLLTYETAYGHQIRVASAPEDADTVRVVIGEAARAMGRQIVSAQTIAGDLIWVDD